MSEPTEGSAITPGVKKQTRRFAPVKRGGSKTAAALKREAAAKAAEPSTDAANTESTSSTAIETTPESLPSTPSNKPLGTIRPEGSGSGRLQSINDGQKTRGGSIKMKFKPTVPLKRNKKEVSSSAIDEALGKSTQFSERGGRGGRGRGAGRGRGRGRGLVIVDESTASGIFSLGPSAVSRGRMGAGGAFASFGGDVPSRTENGEEAESDMVELFTNSVGKDTPVTFRHVSQFEGDIDPVTLKQTVGRIPWMTVKSTPPAKNDTISEVKKETEDVDMDAEQEEKPAVEVEEKEEEVAEELPKLYMDSDSPAQNIFALDEKHRLVCVAEEELLYFQLPTVVPKFEKVKIDELMGEAEGEEEKVKAEENASLPASAKKSVLLEDAMSNLDLEDMPEGQVGTLIMYKSGKMKMKLGNILLDVNQGMQSTFLENVMVVDHESEETKKAIELGHIVQKFVCAPNMDALLTAEEEALV